MADKSQEQTDLGFIHRAQQGEEVVRGGVAHEDQVIRGVLVMAGSVQGYHALQEGFRRLHTRSHTPLNSARTTCTTVTLAMQQCCLFR